jgi:hypothetical protein
VTRAQQVAALDHGQPAQEIADALGCKVGSVYQARWERKHPVPLRKRPAPRAERAVALLAEYQAAGMDDSAAVRKVAREMGIGVNSVRDYRSRLTGTRRNYTEASDSGKPRPHCSGCPLTLFSPEELARGTCNNCLPTSAIAYLGRTGEPVGAMCLPR